MKQAHLGGRTRGLRPGQHRQLDRLSHRRHPEDHGADLLTLERMADLVLELELSMHLVLDGRGLCRLLWLGPLAGTEALRQHLPQAPRRRSGGWRLLSCPFSRHGLQQDPAEAVVALDLNPLSWLRFAAKPGSDGIRIAELLQPERSEADGWHHCNRGDLRELCRQEANQPGLSAPPDAPAAAPAGREQVLLLTLSSGDALRSERELAELEGLVRSAGALPVAVVSQRAGGTNPQTLWGTGKLQEAALEVRRCQASLVVTDRELTPVQARNLERLLACPVSDRSELILDIFAQRAGSAAGRLQVELAQLRYRLPRLMGRGRSLSRQGGGIGTRGPGETQLEKDRRAISRRIEALRRATKQLEEHRARLRDRREGLPRLALVGYTNAGKSSLLNALCVKGERKKVLTENKLFATLDPTTRRLTLPQPAAAARELLITDTVGFIRDLPDALVEAFRATLEEALDADVLLLVVDLADPDWQAQLTAVHRLLTDLGCNKPRLVVANQIDRCQVEAIDAITDQESEVIFISATDGTGLQGLKQRLERQFWEVETDTSTVAMPKPDGPAPPWSN